MKPTILYSFIAYNNISYQLFNVRGVLNLLLRILDGFVYIIPAQMPHTELLQKSYFMQIIITRTLFLCAVVNCWRFVNFIILLLFSNAADKQTSTRSGSGVMLSLMDSCTRFIYPDFIQQIRLADL